MVFTLALSSVTCVYGAKVDDPIPVFDFVNGIEEVDQPIKYNNKELSIKGKALEGTQITVSTYWYNSGNEQSIVFKEKDNNSNEDADGEWVLQHTKKCKVGLSGIFGISVTIKPGKNKIIVKADNEEPYEIEIEYIDSEKITEKINDLMFDGLKLDFE